MTSPVLGNLTTAVNDTVGVMQSAEVALNGVAQKVQDAVSAALANGATADELAPVQLVVDALVAEKNNLANAVAANQ